MDKWDFLPCFFGLGKRGKIPSPFPLLPPRIGIERFLRLYLIKDSSENIERDSFEATRRGESFGGKGIDVTMGLVFRRGDLEEEPKEMLEKEEINCDIKGKDKGGEGGGIMPAEATSSTSVVEWLREIP